MPPRFYCDSLPEPSLSEASCTLDADESRHARKVLRMAVGDRCELFDGRGVVAEAELIGFAGGLARCRVMQIRRVEPARPRLTVASAVPKGPRAEDMVNQLGQLGVDVFVPLRSARSVVEPGAGKRTRYELAALAAAKQAGRAAVMRIADVMNLTDLLTQATDVGLWLDPRGEAGSRARLADRLHTADTATVLIGPEGGWTEAEADAARAAGYVGWKIGEHVLRIETAAVAAAAIVREMTIQ
ncbi:MAG: RsmE family RNA methyltransferase [Planctomycetota bacterium]